MGGWGWGDEWGFEDKPGRPSGRARIPRGGEAQGESGRALGRAVDQRDLHMQVATWGPIVWKMGRKGWAGALSSPRDGSPPSVALTVRLGSCPRGVTPSSPTEVDVVQQARVSWRGPDSQAVRVTVCVCACEGGSC